jgi:spore coat protein U-like protein
MRKLLLAGSALALLGAGSAMAGNSAQTQVTAVNPPSCTITNQSSNLDLGVVVDAAVNGAFSYTCNFDGSPSFTFASLNGGVYTGENGTATADYGIYLNDAAYSSAPSSWLRASASTGTGTTMGGISTTVHNAGSSPVFALGLAAPLPVAGSYSDTLTITIAP